MRYILWFPYYIVRFKQCRYPKCCVFLKGFHTTQYDLNSRGERKLSLVKFSFHTTQYDLNHIDFVNINSAVSRFPYYIVRFKRFCCRRFLCLNFSFPYYIVRFKLFLFPWQHMIEGQFPYYIVRFKPTFSASASFFPSGFHTTQYDLNDEKTKLLSEGMQVSILHSTI